MSAFEIEYVDAALARDFNNQANLPVDAADILQNNYETELEKTWVCKWQSLIAYPIVWTYDFEPSDIGPLRELTRIGIQTGCLSKIFADEIEQILGRLTREWHEGEWFVRLDSLSPKDGSVDCPIREPRQLLEQLCTSKRFQSALASGNRRLYFLDFDSQWQSEYEYRAFVCNGQLTAISQYSTEKFISQEKRITDWKRVIDWLQIDVIERALNTLDTRNFTIDIYLDEGQKILKIIEFNSFGYWLAANGCLFDWTKDRDILYGRKSPNCIFIRLILNMF